MEDEEVKKRVERPVFLFENEKKGIYWRQSKYRRQITNPMSRFETPAVDIDLDALEDTASAEKKAGAPVAIQERNQEMTPAERLASEMTKQREYNSKRAIFQNLQLGLQKMSLPNLDRVSAVLPPEVTTLIEEAVDGLQMLSFYKTLNRARLVKELESMIKGQHLDGEVRRLNDLILQSEASVAKLKEMETIKQASARAATNDIVKAQQIVDSFLPGGKNSHQMQSMPEPGTVDIDLPLEPRSDEKGLWNKVRGMFR